MYSLLEKSYNFFLRYAAPANLGYFWNFGVCAIAMIFVQIISGLFLAMHYIPSADRAFESVEIIMRDVPFGWSLRFIHLNGASFFFVCVYAHLLRGVYYVSYDDPRDSTWVCGIIIIVLMIITAFTGYVLPWGQMGYWAATVITNLVAVIPFVGDYILMWLWGGYGLNTDTLNRFFTIHYLLPFIILALISAHIVFLHEFGSSNPLGYCDTTDKVAFHPSYTYKDIFFVVGFLWFLSYIVIIDPNKLDHADNSLDANPFVTPSHIVPEWYFLVYYAILRSIPSKLLGVIMLVAAILILIALPFIIGGIHDAHEEYMRAEYRAQKIKSEREGTRKPSMNPLVNYCRNVMPYKDTPEFEIMKKRYMDYLYLAWGPGFEPEKTLFWFFFINCCALGFVGTRSMELHWLLIGRMLVINYFLYFLLMAAHHLQVPLRIKVYLRDANKNYQYRYFL